MRIAGILLVICSLAAASPDRSAQVLVLSLDDTIQPASLRYVERGLRRAADERAALVIIELDTPGGLLESLRSMTSAILASPAPVVVYVSPSGSRAASAGFFLLLAADVAAMAPGTHTGAAHPVTLGGGRRNPGDSEDSNDSEEREPANVAVDKITEDAAAFARALAERRGRSVTAAGRAVTDSASFTAKEARAERLIDLIAIDRDQLVAALDDRTITRFDGSQHVLRLQGVDIVEVERTFVERVLGVLAAPQLAYLLLILGALAVVIELTHPGFGVVGIAGGVAVLSGAYGLSLLPVDVVGALLIGTGLALIVAEVFVGHGLLALAGVAVFVIGSFMLVEAPIPALEIGPEVVVPVAAVVAGVAAVLVIRAVHARQLRPQTGIEAMIGELGAVIDSIDPPHDGRVFIHGEHWKATSPHALPAGTRVRVDAIDGLRLRVSAVDTQQGAPT